MISLGSYKLNVEEMLLIREEEKHILEPKVLEVLLYFIENTDRYLTMEELHENVWAGRIVSDAAVRRIISKLRTLLQDDHKTPTYIKSLPKRGYKLICHVNHYIEEPDETSFSVSHTGSFNPNIVSTLDNTLQPSIYRKLNKFKLLFGIFILLSIAVVTIYYNELSREPTKSTQLLSTPILSLPGEKIAVAESENNQFLAFSGKINDEEGYQIFIKKKENHNFIPVLTKLSIPLSLAFSSDNKVLFFSDFKEGNSSLNMIKLNNSEYTSEQLLGDYYAIANIFTSPTNELIYFSGQKTENEPRLIYSYNTQTKDLEQITSSTQDYYFDIKGSISMNGEFLVVVRYSSFEQPNEIRVIELSSHTVTYRRKQSKPIYDLKWLDAEHILLLDEEKLLKINIDDAEEFELIAGKHNLSSFHVVDNSKLLAIKDNAPERLFLEKTLPLKSWEDKSIFNIPSNIYFIRHFTDDSKLILSSENNLITLGRINTQTNKISSYIETEYELELIAYSLSTQRLLIKIDYRFALFDIQTKSLVHLTYADQFVGDATFSHDEQNVLFTVKNYDQWEIKSYQIEDNTTADLLKGFRYVRPYKKDYIVADEKQNLSFYDTTSKEVLDLGYKISPEPNTFWTVQNHYIYWSSHDVLTTHFFELDIQDIKRPVLSQREFNYSKVKPFFTISPDASSILYSQWRETNQDMVYVKID